MANTVSRKALIGHTHHTPRGFIVFNAGKVTKDIPSDLVANLERDGIIEKAAAKSSNSTSSRRSSRRSPARKPAGAANKSGQTATGAATTKTDASNAKAGTSDAPAD